GQGARLVDAALGQRHAFVDAAELERVVDPHVGERLVVGELFDQQHDLAEAVGERRGQRVEGGAGERLDLGGGGRRSEAAHRRRIGAGAATRQGWRSGRDSNPRYGFAVYSLSRRAPSTTRPPLRYRWKGAPVGKRSGSGNLPASSGSGSTGRQCSRRRLAGSLPAA